MSSIAVVSVLFRGGDAVLHWAAALERARDVAGSAAEISVIAIDNASGDGTAELLQAAAPWVTVRRLARNMGFAAGCNAGIALAPADAVVVLINPDVTVREDFFLRIAELRWPEDRAAIGPRIETPSGDLEQSARAFPTFETAFFGRTTLLSKLFPRSPMARRQLLADAANSRPVDWVSGACLVAPAASFRVVGLLDEGYWMYWEDADWCRRARSLGLTVEYRPEIVVTHRQGSSSRSRPLHTQLAFHRSAARYYRCHVARNAAQTRAVELGLLLRAALKVSAAGLRLLRSPRRPAASADDG